MSGSIARYYASIGVQTDMAQLKKVDRYLALVRKKMERFGAGKTGFGQTKGGFVLTPKIKLDYKLAAAQINSQLGHVSRSVVLKINKFKVDTTGLERQVRASILRAMRPIPVNFTNGASSGTRQRVSSVVTPPLAPVERSQRRSVAPAVVSGGVAAGMGSGGSVGGRNSYYAPATRMGFLASTAAGAFGGSGAYRVARLGGALAVPAAFGYGSFRAAKTNQTLRMQPLTHQAVFQGLGKTQEEGENSFSWYKSLANDMGFSYSDNAQEFSSYMANAMGSGMEAGKSQDVYQGFTEYMTAMGTSTYRRKLVYAALSQTLGKGTLSSEEVKRQMARIDLASLVVTLINNLSKR